MQQLIIVGIILIVGIFLFFAPIVQKGMEKNKTKTSNKEFEELEDEYESEESEDENIFGDLYEGILEHNKAVCEFDTVADIAPVNNEVIFDTKPYGVNTDIFGYVIFKYTQKEGLLHKKEIEKVEKFPIFLSGGKTNITIGVVPYKKSALPMGSEGLTVLYGRNKTAFTDNPKSKVKIGDTVKIKTLFGTNEYKVIQYRCASRNAIGGTPFNMSLPNVIFVIGEEHFCTYYFCEFVGTVEEYEEEQE